MDKKIILYAGSDFSTLLTLNKLVPRLVEMGIRPVMIFPEAPKLKNSDSKQVKDFAYYDRELMTDTIIPFMDRRDPILDSSGKTKKNICYTPQQLCDLFIQDGSAPYALSDVNSPEHLDYVQGDDSIIGGISIRCLQIFQQPIIDAHSQKDSDLFQGNGFLWNVHPGRLPDYRGLLPIFRAMADNKSYFDWTLHAISDPSIDTGVVYSDTQQVIDPSKSVLWHYAQGADAVAGMVFKNLEDVLEVGAPRTERTQDISAGNYYSLPSSKRIEEAKDSGVIWLSKPAIEAKELTKAFANGSDLGVHLKKRVELDLDVRAGVESSQPSVQVERRAIERTPPPHSGLIPFGMRLTA